MKYVYLITCFTENGTRHDKNGYPIYGGQQTVGIYFSKKKGLYSCPEVLGFFKYNPEKDGFEPTDEVVNPGWASYVWSIV